MAVWTPEKFSQILPLHERCQQMLTFLENSEQKSFIETCFDNSCSSRNRIKRLLHHPAVKEVPILKLLSAKVIVNSSELF